MGLFGAGVSLPAPISSDVKERAGESLPAAARTIRAGATRRRESYRRSGHYTRLMLGPKFRISNRSVMAHAGSELTREDPDPSRWWRGSIRVFASTLRHRRARHVCVALKGTAREMTELLDADNCLRAMAGAN